jgi:hypothetical protein
MKKGRLSNYFGWSVAFYPNSFVGIVFLGHKMLLAFYIPINFPSAEILLDIEDKLLFVLSF